MLITETDGDGRPPCQESDQNITNDDSVLHYHLTIPARAYSITQLPRPDVVNHANVVHWVSNYIGSTATTIMRIGYSVTEDWSFGAAADDQHPTYSTLSWHSGINKPRHLLVLEVRTPCKFTPTRNAAADCLFEGALNLKELGQFCDTERLPSLDHIPNPGGARTFDKRERTVSWDEIISTPSSLAQALWAKLYDACVLQRSYFFIVTTVSSLDFSGYHFLPWF